jgi:ABC-type sulfate/molybdate transport systems ATPase subunit
MTAIENVAFGIPPGVRGDERSARARSWLDRLHVGRLAERRPTTFSGGEAQRVAVARALASEPRALLLDEPFTALDAPLREAVGDEIRALVVELGLVAILVTHDRAEALRLGDRAVTLAHGAVVAKGTPPEVL